MEQILLADRIRQQCGGEMPIAFFSIVNAPSALIKSIESPVNYFDYMDAQDAAQAKSYGQEWAELEISPPFGSKEWDEQFERQMKEGPSAKQILKINGSNVVAEQFMRSFQGVGLPTNWKLNIPSIEYDESTVYFMFGPDLDEKPLTETTFSELVKTVSGHYGSLDFRVLISEVRFGPNWHLRIHFWINQDIKEPEIELR